MDKKSRGLCTVMTRMRKNGQAVKHHRTGLLLLVFSLLWALPGCGKDVSAQEYPPTVETVQAEAEALHWSLDTEGIQSPSEDLKIYPLEAGEQMTVSVSCGLSNGDRVLSEVCICPPLLEKPQFAWEDWKDAVTLAEALYGISEGELYEALTGQEMPEPELPTSESEARPGQESLSWEAELPSGYGRVRWSISAGTVTHTFPSPIIHDWRMNFSITLYESREVYESIRNA